MVNTCNNRLLVPVTLLLCWLVWWGSLECGIAHSNCGDLFFWVWIGSSNLRSSNTLIKDILGQRSRWRGDSLKAVQIFMCFVGQSGMSRERSRQRPTYGWCYFERDWPCVCGCFLEMATRGVMAALHEMATRGVMAACF